jgi:uncharacterized protein GlcG (DUF336 family)
MIEMTLELAQRVARGAQERAKQLGVPMTISVVDAAGRLVYCARGDGTGFMTPDTARAKAVAAAAFRRATMDMVELRKSNPFWDALPSISRGEVLTTGGAVPILSAGRVVGAIGCGGGTPQQDHECAQAGASLTGA